uniref:Uncharacterized protein n=1 Tax=Arundo donax TaxID=35708 RepID=A0A0A9HQN8_ARUDO
MVNISGALFSCLFLEIYFSLAKRVGTFLGSKTKRAFSTHMRCELLGLIQLEILMIGQHDLQG